MMYDKVLGSMVAAAIGDAMGTPLESRPIYLIKQDLGQGGFVYDYCDMPKDSFAPHMKKGFVSDDFSISFASLKAIVKHGGVTRDAVIEGLLDWRYGDQFKLYSSSYLGPTTAMGIQKLEGTYEPTYMDSMECHQKTITNGAAMKAWICGLLTPGNLDKAIDNAITLGLPTHDNVIALSAAGAVAAGVAKAMVPGATTDQVVEAGLYGAQEGYRRALEVAHDAAGASVEKRIGLAVEIGLKYSNDFEACITEMTDIVGTGLFANEAVPAAFGFFVSAGGDVMETIYRSINAGNDCDTVATMAGALAGALRGYHTIPPHHLPFLSQTNGMDIEQMAKDVCSLIQ